MLSSQYQISKFDTLSLLSAISSNVAGGLYFESRVSEYRRVDARCVSDLEMSIKSDVHRLGGEHIALWDGKVEVSVAGAQDKIDLSLKPCGYKFTPKNTPNSHILKLESENTPNLCVNELFTANLATFSGLDAAEVAIVGVGGSRGLIVRRFDRKYCASTSSYSRLHVIDGCQLANVPPAHKYERQFGDDGFGYLYRGGVSFKHLLTEELTRTEGYAFKIVQWMIFNLVSHNYDAHGKNISFFMDEQGLRLAPFYDLVNIFALVDACIERDSFPAMNAMSIGGYDSVDKGNFEPQVTAYMLADFGAHFNIDPELLAEWCEATLTAIVAALDKAKFHCLKFDLTSDEVEHIDACIAIVEFSAKHLQTEVLSIVEMSELVL